MRLPWLVVPNPKLKLMDQMREVLRVRHYAIRTEQCYCDWIRRYIRFHGMRSREELLAGTGKVESFLSDLAINGNVAASTQNQAFNALLFLYREVLHQPFENIQAVRAKRPVRVPVVLTIDEIKQVLSAMSGTPQLMAKLLYVSGDQLHRQKCPPANPPGGWRPDTPLASSQQCGEGSGVLEVLQLSVELKFGGGVELEQTGAEFTLEHLGHGLQWS